MNKDSVTDAAIPLHSFIKSWLKFSYPTEQRLSLTKQRNRKNFYRLLLLITRLDQILKRLSLNTGISFKSNLDLHISLTSHRLYISCRKEKSLKDVLVRAKVSFDHAAIVKTCKQRSNFKRFFFKPEGNLYMTFCLQHAQLAFANLLLPQLSLYLLHKVLKKNYPQRNIP